MARSVNTRFKGDEAAYVLEEPTPRPSSPFGGFLDTDYVACCATCPALALPGNVVLLSGAEADERTFDEFLAGGDASTRPTPT